MPVQIQRKGGRRLINIAIAVEELSFRLFPAIIEVDENIMIGHPLVVELRVAVRRVDVGADAPLFIFAKARP